MSKNPVSKSPAVSRRTALKGIGALGGIGLAAGFGMVALPRRAWAADKFVHQLGWVKSIQFGGHFAAIEHGYFAEENIEAEFLSGGPGTDPHGTVISGKANTSDDAVPAIVLLRAKGVPIKGFAAIMQRAPDSIMSLAETPIRSIEDFVGKTIAMPSSVRPQMNALIKRAGVKQSDVRFVPVGTDPGILPAKQVDGYYGWASNQGVMLMARGVDIHIAYLDELGAPGYAGVLFADEKNLEENFDLFVRWLRADIKGWHWHLENPEEMAQLMVDKHGQKGLDLRMQTIESNLMHEIVNIGAAREKGLLWAEPDVFAAGIEFAKESGALPADSNITPDDVLTQDVLKAVYG